HESEDEKRTKLEQFYRKEDIKHRIRLKISNIADLSHSRLNCVRQEKQRNKTKNISLVDSYGTTSEDPNTSAMK
ncbi:Uncharacterized protein FKW44_015821, partial [Caligus rogercresseyi]